MADSANAVRFSTSLEKVLEQALFQMSFDIRDAVVQAAGEAVNKTNPTFRAAYQAITSGIQSRTAFRQAHQELAQEAREAVLDSYDERVEGNKELASYRVGAENRLGGGKLRRALGRAGMFVGTYEGVAFGNEDILDQEAAHWWRLNYGAGAPPLYSPGTFKIGIGGRQIFENLSLDHQPGKRFRMPKGYWGDGGYGYGFYPRSTTLNGPYATIQGRRFFDAGIEAIGDQLGNVYYDLVARLLEDASKTGRGAGKNITVSPKLFGFR